MLILLYNFLTKEIFEKNRRRRRRENKEGGRQEKRGEGKKEMKLCGLSIGLLWFLLLAYGTNIKFLQIKEMAEELPC